MYPSGIIGSRGIFEYIYIYMFEYIYIQELKGYMYIKYIYIKVLMSGEYLIPALSPTFAI